MNELKCSIRQLLNSGEKCDELLEEYETCYPADLDLYEMKARNALLWGDKERAYAIAKQAVIKNPYNLEANFCMRKICEANGLYIEALKYAAIGNVITEFCNLEKKDLQDDAELQEKISRQEEQLAREGDKETLKQYIESLDWFKKQSDYFFGVFDQRFWSIRTTAGSYMWDVYGKSMYAAVYYGCGMDDAEGSERRRYNPLESKLEFREVFETTDYFMKGEGDREYLLPVLARENYTTFCFTDKGQETFVCKNRKGNHFNYYRITSQTRIQAEQTLLIGKPIELKQNPSNKKLVLNIFIDGLSQKVLEEEGLCEVMPNTYRFFKKGVICTNAYTAAEWTLPSLASYNSGLDAPHHRLIHNTLTAQFPEDVTLLAEYFKEQGYTTAKIDGDWRSTLSYGYGRGMDRIIYQHQNAGMKADEVISDVLDHMKMMRETDQYIWMTVGDLHDIADGFDLKPSIQSVMPLEERVADEVGATSVKQAYSERKRAAYIWQMRYIDNYLQLLYEYIENHYSDEEIVVSAFGDHGQGYLVRDDEHFLAPGRSKVGMMFRGGDWSDAGCDELISTCDYVPIMCRLAGIPLKDEKIDGNLPMFFGGTERRKFAVTDSIHPGDCYMASVVSDDGVFYLTSESTVEYDGRFCWGEYTCCLHTGRGEILSDKSELSEYVQQVKEHVSEWLIV